MATPLTSNRKRPLPTDISQSGAVSVGVDVRAGEVIEAGNVVKAGEVKTVKGKWVLVVKAEEVDIGRGFDGDVRMTG